jgi:sterol carrier protein
VNVVLDVVDPLCPWNAGRWRLDAGPAGATCVPDRSTADLSLSVRELGSAMLGDAPLVQFAAAGLIDEHSHGAAAALARALTHERAPCCAMVF